MDDTLTPGVGADQELDAMRAVAAALGKVDPASARRVLAWAAERWGVTLPGPGPRKSAATLSSAGVSTAEPPQDLATFFAEAAPRTGPEKALVVAYHQQVVQGIAELDAQALNSELKHLGHNIANITVTLLSLINQTPSLLVQTKKLGRGRQARKRYKITNSGMLRVREMLATTREAEG